VLVTTRAASVRRAAFTAILAIAGIGCSSAPVVPAGGGLVSSERFESEIVAFEDSDRVHPPSAGGIVFVGSSSIRLWPDLRGDFPGAHVIQRGFGGARLDEVLRYAPRIVLPYKPRLIVLYAGENDLAEGRKPAEVVNDYKSFVTLIQQAGTAHIIYISIKPSPSRWQLADKMRETNAMIKEYTLTHTYMGYIDVFSQMIGPNGRPRSELFVSDSLHMNHEGYALWRRLLTPVVLRKDN
jgi:lysophospholipase L1-like esterase